MWLYVWKSDISADEIGIFQNVDRQNFNLKLVISEKKLWSGFNPCLAQCRTSLFQFSQIVSDHIY